MLTINARPAAFARMPACGRKKRASQAKLERPTDEDLEQGIPFPPGYCHFPRYSAEYFKQLTAESMQALVEQDLGHPQRLDGLAASGVERGGRRRSIVTGPELMFHIAAGNLPNPTLTSVVLGVLVRSAQFVKCASGTSLLPRLFAHSLHEAEPKLGACLEIAEWRGGREDLEQALARA